MADNWGLIGSGAATIREAMTSYQTVKNQKRQEQMMGLLQGVQENPETGQIDYTPEMKAKKQQEMSEYQPFTEEQRQYYEGISGQQLPQGMTPAQYKQFGHLAEAKIKGQTLADQVGRKAADTAFGKEYADYEAGGGSAAVDKNINLLNEAIEDMRSGKVKTGGISGLLGESVQDITSPDVASVRDKIRSAVQGTLKQVLGGQYTEREGQAIFNRAFNPRLSNKENIRRAVAELEALKEMAGSKNQATKYFQQHGTLTGFKKQKGLIQSKKSVKKPVSEMTEEEIDAELGE
jgi:hypothetical protein